MLCLSLLYHLYQFIYLLKKSVVKNFVSSVIYFIWKSFPFFTFKHVHWCVCIKIMIHLNIFNIKTYLAAMLHIDLIFLTNTNEYWTHVICILNSFFNSQKTPICLPKQLVTVNMESITHLFVIKKIYKSISVPSHSYTLNHFWGTLTKMCISQAYHLHYITFT